MTERMKMKCKQDMEEGSSPDRIRYPSLDHLQHRPPSSIPPGTALIGRDQSSRYCALIGGNLQRHFYLLCWIYILLLKPLVSYTLETSPQPKMAYLLTSALRRGLWVPQVVSLWHKRAGVSNILNSDFEW